MARSGRALAEGAIYHVVGRGNNRQDIFLGDDERGRFLGLLVDVGRTHNWDGYAYCLMG